MVREVRSLTVIGTTPPDKLTSFGIAVKAITG
jgi:hypothetical protein